MIPPFGKNYVHQWAEEEARIVNLFNDGVINPSVAVNREYAEVEDTVYDGDLHLGKLSERLIASFLREGIVPDQTDDDEDPLTSVSQKNASRPRTKTDLSLMEERLRAELVHTGLITNDGGKKEDNEISSLLLSTQEELRHQIIINSSRKKMLLKVAEEHMAYQEYNTLLDEVNKAVVQAYTKRFVYYCLIAEKLYQKAKEIRFQISSSFPLDCTNRWQRFCHISP